MPQIRILISGSPGPWPNSRNGVDHEGDLKRSLQTYLGNRGYILDEDEDEDDRGSGWEIKIVLRHERDIEGWVDSLTSFLRTWGVPKGPIAFSTWNFQT